MGSTSKKVRSAFARLKKKYLFWDKDEDTKEANISVGDEMELRKILEAYGLGPV